MTELRKKRRRRRLVLIPVAAAVFFLAFLAAAQLFAHRRPYFTPGYAMVDLSPLLEQPALTREDYDTLFLQTGLGASAVDALLGLGEAGQAQIRATQAAFFAPPQNSCESLGLFTREDHSMDGGGNLAYGFPMAPLEDGDVLLSFSTHTLGWRHGHAGLVVDAAQGLTLEAVLMGTDSATVDARHWQIYSTFLHLRVRDITPEQQRAVADFALAHLDGIPYHLTSGIFGADKFPEADSSGFGAQCAYLVWYALMAQGFDTDSDGGRIVTVGDLLGSPLFEVVQVYGMDPAQFMERAS